MNHRILTINAEIQKAIAEIINYEMKNPMITGIITVTSVDTTADLEYAKVYISVLDSDKKEDVLNALKHSAGFIRKEVCKKVDIRKMPYFTFILDNSYEYGNMIENKIKEINREKDSL